MVPRILEPVKIGLSTFGVLTTVPAYKTTQLTRIELDMPDHGYCQSTPLVNDGDVPSHELCVVCFALDSSKGPYVRHHPHHIHRHLETGKGLNKADSKADSSSQNLMVGC